MTTFPFAWPFPIGSGARSAGRSVSRVDLRERFADVFKLRERRYPDSTCVAFDIVAFGTRCREDDLQIFVHLALYEILKTAFRRAGIAWKRSHREDRGDGAVIVVPPSTPPAVLIGPLIAELADSLRQYNKFTSDAVQIRLRMAVHSGPVFFDANGMVGQCLVHLYRMLEAPEFKDAVASSGTDLGVIASERIYREVIDPKGSAGDRGPYQPIEVVLKETRSPAWMCVCDGPRPVALRNLVSA